MLDLDTIARNVEQEEALKSDVTVKMRDLTPLALENGETRILMGGRKEFKLTTNGLQSLLSKAKIPYQFYKKSSGELKRKMLDEHYRAEVENSDGVLRTRRKNDTDYIRYIASSKYSKFDDLHLVRALQKSEIANYDIREFHQNDEMLVMRATVGDPIVINGRPFFVGMQAMNSEVGRSSVDFSFMIWEEVCTNGMTVTRDTFGRFRMRHIGKRGEDLVYKKANSFLGKMGNFKDYAAEKLERLSGLTYEEIVEHFEARVPQRVIKSVNEDFLPKYAGPEAVGVEGRMSADGLSVMCSFTEAIQQYNWEQRTDYETTAGDILSLV